MPRKKRSSMGKLADKTARETDEALRNEELELLADTTIDWEALRPQVTDQENYDKLIGAVNKATAGNESIAQLRQRLESLGKGGVALAKKVAGLVG